MKNWAVLLAAAVTASCSTTGLQQRAPIQTYHSSHSRAVVRECLLNRLAGGENRARVQDGAAETHVSLVGMVGQGLLDFRITDEGAGSLIELRRLSSITPGRTNAETCF